MVLALDGSHSQLVASTQSKAPALQLAASSSCTLGHSSDQLRHSWAELGTAHHDLTRARRRVQHLAQPWTEGLGSGPWAGLGQAAHREPLWGGIMQH